MHLLHVVILTVYILLTTLICINILKITIGALSIDLVLWYDFEVYVFLLVEAVVGLGVSRRTQRLLGLSGWLRLASSTLDPLTRLIFTVAFDFGDVLFDPLGQRLFNGLVVAMLPTEFLGVFFSTTFSTLGHYDVLLKTLSQLNRYFDIL